MFVSIVFAQIRNLGLGGRTCLDSPARKKDLKKAVGLYPCHNQGGNQVNKEKSKESNSTVDVQKVTVQNMCAKIKPQKKNRQNRAAPDAAKAKKPHTHTTTYKHKSKSKNAPPQSHSFLFVALLFRLNYYLLLFICQLLPLINFMKFRSLSN